MTETLCSLVLHAMLFLFVLFLAYFHSLLIYIYHCVIYNLLNGLVSFVLLLVYLLLSLFLPTLPIAEMRLGDTAVIEQIVVGENI